MTAAAQPTGEQLAERLRDLASKVTADVPAVIYNRHPKDVYAILTEAADALSRSALPQQGAGEGGEVGVAPAEKPSHLDEPVKGGWLTIDSAPKDGTFIIGWCRQWAGYPVQCRYLTGLGRWNTAMQPTHWMPLPEPPK